MTMRWLCSIVFGAAILFQIECHASSRSFRRFQPRPTVYDVGCYAETSKRINMISNSKFEEGKQLPSCAPGGLYHRVQCSNNNCYCVYIDTGKRFGTLSLENSTYRELLTKCPKKMEKLGAMCKVPPINYPCNFWQRRYMYNANANRCERTYFGCRGFLSRNECQRNCGNVTIVLEITNHKQFRAMVPASLLGRFNLERRRINRVTTRIFRRILSHALAIRTQRKPSRFAYGKTMPTIRPATTTTTTTTTTATTTTMTTLPVPLSTTTPPDEEIERNRSEPESICLLPLKTGFCRGFYPRWYFDLSESRCKKFIYGGCSGNGNNFLTEDECIAYCQEKRGLTDNDEEQSGSGSI